MIVNCGRTISQRLDDWSKARRERLTQWHLVFVIFPKRISDTECAFFEIIERKAHYYKGTALMPETGTAFPVEKRRWEYRAPERQYAD